MSVAPCPLPWLPAQPDPPCLEALVEAKKDGMPYVGSQPGTHPRALLSQFNYTATRAPSPPGSPSRTARCPICTLRPPCSHTDPSGKDREAEQQARRAYQRKQTEYERFYLETTMGVYRETSKVTPEVTLNLTLTLNG